MGKEKKKTREKKERKKKTKKREKKNGLEPGKKVRKRGTVFRCVTDLLKSKIK